MKYPWEQDFKKPKSWERSADVMGGHTEIDVDYEMYKKNIETAGGYQAKVSGNQGELKLSSILSSLPDCYHIIDNVLLQNKDKSTQIDHIIVSPFGIFIVETKNHKGLIFGDSYGKVWTQVLKNGHFTFYSPVLQNQGHIKHLSSQIRIPENYMQGVIVFTNNDANLEAVNCSWCLNVDQFYRFIYQYQNVIFNQKQVMEIIRRIDRVNKDGYLNRQRHIAFVNKQKERRKS